METLCGVPRDESFNGMIVCEVLSRLTAPIDGASAYVLLSVHAEDLALYSPCIGNYAGTMAIDEQAEPYIPQSYDVSCGDSFASTRQLLKRKTRAFSTIVPGSTTIAAQLVVGMKYTLPVMMPPPGYSLLVSGSLFTDRNVPGVAVNYTIMTFRMFLQLAFAMVRGAIRHHYVGCLKDNSTFESTTLSVTRDYTYANFASPADRITYEAIGRPTAGPYSYPDEYARWKDYAGDFSQGGQMALITKGASGTSSPAVCDVQYPHTSIRRAYFARSTAAIGLERNNFTIVTEIGASTQAVITLDVFESVGEDFNLFGFIHAPAVLTFVPRPLT